MHYFIKFSYDGSKFYGFQRQKDKTTVQQKIEEALSIINKNPVEIKGAGRTDIGVHANGQCASFSIDFPIPEKRLMTALNSIVHPYIHILECKKVSENFHARFSAIGKKYIYKIWQGNYNPTFYDYYLMYPNKINIKKLKECAKIFIGSHDFHNFVSGNRKNYHGTIFDIQIKKRKNEMDIIFIGKSFYRYMVRNLVGAMFDYQEDKCDLALLKKMLESDFTYQLRTAEAKGLYLDCVYYDKR